MLVDIDFKQEKLDNMLKKANENFPDTNTDKWRHKLEDIYFRVTKGIYYTSGNFSHDIKMFSDSKVLEDFCSFSPRTFEECRTFDWSKNRENYGVCDNYKQIFKVYPELKNSDRKFTVSLTCIRRDTQPAENGWRWERWGKYIGKQKSTADFLHDERYIKEIFIYHIYEME